MTILRRFADRIVLLFDADAAGDSAVNRAVELFLTQPVEIAIASLPDGMDPDEYLLAHGAEAFDGRPQERGRRADVHLEAAGQQFKASGDNLTGQQKAVKQYLDVLNKARSGGPVDSLRWGSALSRVSRLTDIPVEELNRRFSQPAHAAGPRGRNNGRGRQAAVAATQAVNPFRDDPNGQARFKKGDRRAGWADRIGPPAVRGGETRPRSTAAGGGP